MFVPEHDWRFRFGDIDDDAGSDNPAIYIEDPEDDVTVCTIENYEENWIGRYSADLRTVPLLAAVPRMIGLLQKSLKSADQETKNEITEFFKSIEFQQQNIWEMRHLVNEFRDAIIDAKWEKSDSDEVKHRETIRARLGMMCDKLGWEWYDR